VGHHQSSQKPGGAWVNARSAHAASAPLAGRAAAPVGDVAGVVVGVSVGDAGGAQ